MGDAAPIVDPTVAKKYPVILSDALLGHSGQEIFTAVRYNHKPSELDNANARLRPVGGKANEFQLTYNEDGNKHVYSGTRTTDDPRLIMWFDPKRQAMILDRVDSTFHMNIKSTPSEDTETLEKRFPKLDIKPPSKPDSRAATTSEEKPTTGKKKAAPKAAAKPKAPKKTPAAKPKEPKKKAAPKKKAVPLALPTAPPPEAEKPKEKSPVKAKDSAAGTFFDYDDEDDEDDGSLVIEWNDAPAPVTRPTQAIFKTFGEFVEGRKLEGDELVPDGEVLEDGEDDGGLFDASDDDRDNGDAKAEAEREESLERKSWI